jgi:hypothetical protein
MRGVKRGVHEEGQERSAEDRRQDGGDPKDQEQIKAKKCEKETEGDCCEGQ